MSERARGRRPRSPRREGESSRDRKRRHDRERAREKRQRLRLNPIAAQEQPDRHARQERERLNRMSSTERDTERENNTLQRRNNRANMGPEQQQTQRANNTSQRRNNRANMGPEQQQTQRANNTLLMQIRRANMNLEEQQTQRANNRLGMRTHRANMAPEEQQTQRANNTSQRRNNRANMGPEQQQTQRANNTSRMQNHRANMGPEQQQTQRANNTSRMQNHRANMGPEEQQTQRANNTSRMQNHRANMAPEQQQTQRANNTSRMQNHRANMAPEQQQTQTANNRVRMQNYRSNMEPEAHQTQTANNTLQRRNNRQRTFDPDRYAPDEEYLAFFQSCDENHPLDQHPFVKEMQDKFHKSMNAYQMRHCSICRERWMTKNCLDIPLNEYECYRCKTDKGTPKRFSEANSAIPVTLVGCSALHDVADATVLECMLVSLACPVMRVARHIGSGSTVYQSHCVNFIQDISTFYTTNTIPRAARNTPYFYVKRTGSDGTVAEARVRREVVRRLILYLIQNNPLYANLNIDEQALQALPEDGIPPEIIIQVDNNNDDGATGEVNVGANNSVGNTETTLGLPVIQQRESGAIVDALTELENNTMADRISQQTRERNQLAPAGGNEPTGPRFQWPQIGSEPLNEFTTEHLAAMCFPELFLNGAGDPTSSDRLRDVNETDFARHLIKFCVKTSDGKYVYPFAEHDRFGGWMQSRIERMRTLSQANYCMKEHPQLQYTSIAELAALSRNAGAASLVQHIYKYVSNITGSDPYWFTRRRELIAQANQEGLSGTLFFTFSAADNHWRKLMELLDIPHDAPIHDRREAVRKNPHIVDHYFCCKIKEASKYLLREALIADWIWYRYEFQLRGATHAHGMIKCKFPINILDLVSKAYAGRKATLKLEAMSFYRGMSEEEKNQFKEAARKDADIKQEYERCVDANTLTDDEIQKERDCALTGIESETKVLQFHTWLVSTMNEALPPLSDDLKQKQNEKKQYQTEIKKITLKISVRNALRKPYNDLLQEKDEYNEKIEAINQLFQAAFDQCESDFSQEPQYMADPHPCSADFDEVKDNPEHYKRLLGVERHKCVGTYCMRRKKNAQGEEYGDPYCRFGYPLELYASASLEFEELDNGGVRAKFYSMRNDTRMNQHCKMHLKAWQANCDLQVVLDEDQAVRYLVKYATKPETRGSDVNDLIRSFIPQRNATNDEEEDNDEQQEGPPQEETEVSGKTLIRRMAIKSIGERNRSKQEIMHLLLSEDMYSSDFSYVNVHLDKHDVRKLRLQRGTNDDAEAFYNNIFDFYMKRDENESHLSFVKFCRKYQISKDGNTVKERHKRTVVITFPNRSSDPASPYFHQYCKFFLIKHKPWRESIDEAWDGPIFDDENNEIPHDDYNSDVVKDWYSTKYYEFLSLDHVNLSELEMFNSDVARLRRIRDEYDVEYQEEEEALGNALERPDGWMTMAGMAQNDAAIHDDLAPVMDASINWVEIRKTPEEKLDTIETYLDTLKSQNPTLQRPLQHNENVVLNREQRFSVEVVKRELSKSADDRSPVMILGGPGVGKSTVIGCISSEASSNNNDVVVRLGTTGTAAFGIAGSTCHSKLYLPINTRYKDLKGASLVRLQERFSGKKLVIVDEVSMMGKKMLDFIDKRLRQADTSSSDKLFGGFMVVFVGDFRQLPPVGDTAMYIPGNDNAHVLLYKSFKNVVFLQKSERQDADDEDSASFKRILEHCETGELDKTDWEALRTRFIGRASDASDIKWNDAVRLFYDNKSVFEYNMQKLKRLGKPIAKIQAYHNTAAAAKRDSSECRNLQACLYLSVGSKVMLTQNLWSEVGLHNGAKGEVVDIVYRHQVGPLGNALPLAIVVQFEELSDEIEPFLEDVERSVPIPLQTVEWTNPSDISKKYIRKQFPLTLSWAFTFHKSQGKTLPLVALDLGRCEKCAGMTLVGLSRVRRLKDLLLKPFSLERLKKVNEKKQLKDVKEAIDELKQRAEDTKRRFGNLWNVDEME